MLVASDGNYFAYQTLLSIVDTNSALWRTASLVKGTPTPGVCPALGVGCRSKVGFRYLSAPGEHYSTTLSLGNAFIPLYPMPWRTTKVYPFVVLHYLWTTPNRSFINDVILIWAGVCTCIVRKKWKVKWEVKWRHLWVTPWTNSMTPIVDFSFLTTERWWAPAANWTASRLWHAVSQWPNRNFGKWGIHCRHGNLQTQS